MKIILNIDGKDKTFVNDFVKGRIFRNALLLNKKLKDEGGDFSVELFDAMIEFVVSAFDKQFSVDEFWDGIEAHKLQDEVMRIFNEILNFGGLTTEGNEMGE
ncbi:hypothetical protein GN156_03970 [bacterium LRH843]|nr:hypothetical protein [bacterium LRH843]